MKDGKEIMEILEAYDLTESYRAAGVLAGCDHKTVKHHVDRRDAGLPAGHAGFDRDQLIDAFTDHVEGWVAKSRGKARADVIHRKLVVMGYGGSERTTRRAVEAAKKEWRSANRRIYMPWVPEPGGWLQFDYGEGPLVAGRRTVLFCAWLAWSRFRVVIPILDKTMPTVIACLDQTFRILGGAPTSVLTDNEKTVTIDRIAGIAVVNPMMARAAGHYGISVRACEPADPESKGGSEATVKIAKADLVPTDANLLDAYATFADLEAACEEWTATVNARPHRLLGIPPVQALARELEALHPIPGAPFAAAFGTTRTVTRDATISVGGVRYSVPHTLVDESVWTRWHGEELVVVHHGPAGPAEIARHTRSTKGHPRINPDHYPARSTIPGRTPKPVTPEERAFLAIGDGAREWLLEAATVGTSRMRVKMSDAIQLAQLLGNDPVDRALGQAAMAGRFAERDLGEIIDYLQHHDNPDIHRAGEDASLQTGLAGWKVMGR